MEKPHKKTERNPHGKTVVSLKTRAIRRPFPVFPRCVLSAAVSLRPPASRFPAASACRKRQSDSFLRLFPCFLAYPHFTLLSFLCQYTSHENYFLFFLICLTSCCYIPQRNVPPFLLIGESLSTGLCLLEFRGLLALTLSVRGNNP